MAFTEKYANFDLTTGSNDGTSEANAWKTPAAVIAGVAAGDRVNIKKQATPYDMTASLTFSTSGTATAPIHYRGYTSTIGDGGMWEIAYNAPGVASLLFTGNYVYVESVSFQPGAKVNFNEVRINGNSSWCIRCDLATRGTSSAFSNVLFSKITNEYAGGRISTARVQQSNSTWHGSLIQRIGTTTQSQLIYRDSFGTSMSLTNCLIIGNSNSGESAFFLDRGDNHKGLFVSGCRFYDFDSGIVIDEEPNIGYESAHIFDNVFSTMAAYAVKRTNVEVGHVRLLRNYYHSCTSGLTNYSSEAQVFGNTSLSASPYTDAANADLTLNNTAGGGKVLRDAGFAINHPYDYANMVDLGVFQGSGGGGARLVMMNGATF